MVRLPIYENEQNLDTGSSFFRQADDSGVRALSRGINDLGEGVSQFAAQLAAKDEKLQAFAAQKELLDLEERTDGYIDNRKSNISETGQDFHRSTMEVVQKDVDNVLTRIPENMRPEYELKIKQFLNARSDQLRNIEFAQGKSYISEISQRTIDRLSKNVTSGLWDVPTATLELESFVDGAGLPSEVAAVFKREGMRAVESSRLEYQRINNPQAFLKDVLKYMPNSPAAGANPYQKIAIEQATAHGVDPLTILTIGQLESGWNPNAKASKTIFGLYQLSADLRKELGIPENMKGDPALQTEGIIRMVKSYQSNLAANNIEESPVTVWASHFLGRGGVVAMWQSDPNADAYSVYARVAGPRIAKMAFSSNGDLLKPGMTVGQVRAAITRNVSRGMTEARKAISDKPNYDPSAPIEIAGEKFSFLTAGDLGKPYAEAAGDVQKQTDARFDQMSRLAVDAGSVNSYSSEGRSAINKAVGQSELPLKLGERDPSAFVESRKLVETYKFLPAPLSQQAMSMMASQDLTTKAAGYDLLYSAHSADTIRGLENSGVVDENRKRVETYGNLRSVYRLSPEEAAAQTDRVYSEEYKAKLANVDATRLKDEKAMLSWNQLEKSLNLDKTFLFWGSDETPNDTSKQAIMNRYRTRFEYHYRDTQNREVARANAIADIANSHGVTSSTPRSQFVLYPPERYLPKGKDGTHAYVGKQLEEFVTDYVDDQADRAKDPTIKNIDKSRVSIAGTPDTGYDIQAGRYPRYEVFYVDHRGNLQMIPGSFTPNPEVADGFNPAGTSSQKEAAPEAQKTASDNLKKAKEDRDRLNASRAASARRGR
jgi:hypothetical protein